MFFLTRSLAIQHRLNLGLFYILQLLALGTLGLLTACSSFSQAQNESSPVVEAVPTPTVVALGRLAPDGEVIKLSVPNAEDSRVNQILVAEGDTVEADQVIAILQGFERRQRDLEEARKTVEFYQARLDQLQAGSGGDAEVAAQEAAIARLEAQLRTEQLEREAAIASAEADVRQAQQDYTRDADLAAAGAISQQALETSQQTLETTTAMLDQRRAQLANTLETLEQQISQEQNNLAQLREVRPVDRQVAQVELDRARIAVEQRQADLEDTQVRVPVAGQILRINTRVGEQVNTQQGIVELGRTEQMYAIAEVYETDIVRVQTGQPATITSEYGGFEGEVRGIVDHVGLQIGDRQLSEGSSNPTQDENARIVEVKIRIVPEDNPKIAALTNMQVRVAIDVSAS
ncbi:MAG: HlyD family efflux transporter periplasmic adaptor subunit [Cyanobacteria bacterium J06559_3]